MTPDQEQPVAGEWVSAMIQLADKYARASVDEERTRQATGGYPPRMLSGEARMALQRALAASPAPTIKLSSPEIPDNSTTPADAAPPEPPEFSEDDPLIGQSSSILRAMVRFWQKQCAVLRAATLPEPKQNAIADKLRVMIGSAVAVVENDGTVVGYRVKTGALHSLIGVLGVEVPLGLREQPADLEREIERLKDALLEARQDAEPKEYKAEPKQPEQGEREASEADALDARRLDWLSAHEAWIGWNREGDMCSVWTHGDGEDSDQWVSLAGQGRRHYSTHREAIDAAMQQGQSK